MNAHDVRLNLVRQNVNLLHLSEAQQMLCVAALAELSINGYRTVSEYSDAFQETRTAACIGEIGGAETAVLFGGMTLASHLPDLVQKSSSLVNSALLDKTSKPRAIPTVAEPLTCEMPNGQDEPNQSVDPMNVATLSSRYRAACFPLART